MYINVYMQRLGVLVTLFTIIFLLLYRYKNKNNILVLVNLCGYTIVCVYIHLFIAQEDTNILVYLLLLNLLS